MTVDRLISLGLDTFGEPGNGPGGQLVSHPQAIRDVVAEAVAADALGLDYFGVGEHHIDEMPISAPEVVLAAIAARTSRIRLSSAVTVLSSDDPVRVYQRFATVDAVSGGRADVMLGRGSSIDSFPLYGFDLADYELLFEEKLDLFAKLRDEQPITWQGRTRAPLTGQEVVPRTEAGLPVWVGVGGSPPSVVRAARHGLHVMFAVIGGDPVRFARLADLYRSAFDRLGGSPGLLGVHAPGHVAATDEEAAEEYWPFYRDFLPEKRAARGIPQPTPESFRHEIGPTGALFVGSPDTVSKKIVRTMTALGAHRFDLKYGIVGLPHASALRAITLFGSEVAPRVRAAIGQAVPNPTR
ncbi:LLM class flavin-dependent oxidoreductase [Amycolatopsis pithecellobii]|uniref:LLM class flavin-dependent oxidoreductase n=1 Tax=Amycolatopsis pithecellobii TaxID=664692 RepID=A0A6N7YMZ7_9PSEU|nr:LLM class flavin-dependent oxidoreductase [Amycolatopsis pithecellobii]MTD54357.1 LLM class flavin-dependent oxidoreductase [Amycolatopsis pithecellobii]